VIADSAAQGDDPLFEAASLQGFTLERYRHLTP
jgi:hypothetical protein